MNARQIHGPRGNAPSVSAPRMNAAARPLEREISNYLSHLKLGRALTDNTLAAYGRDLHNFSRSLEERGLAEIGALSSVELRQYLAQESERGLSSRSLSRALSTLRGFLRYLVEEGKLDSDLGRDLPRPRLGRRLPRAAREDELVALLRAPDLETARGRRDRALLSLTYAAGLRASEVVGLTVGDLDLDRGTVCPLGKGKKRRLVPLGELALADLNVYLRDLAATEPRASAPWLFPGAKGRPLSRQAFWKIVKGHGQGAGLARAIHPHVLRHSFATHLVWGGADLRSVQLLLGHESITTTEVYTQVSPEHVRRAFETSHPRAGRKIPERVPAT
jgi:integrase/recombinase XerD